MLWIDKKKAEKNMGKINGDASREKTTLQDHRVKTRNMNFKLMYTFEEIKMH